MTTILQYHVLWQVTFPLCTSQWYAASLLRSRCVRGIPLKRILATESSVDRKTHQWAAATSSWAVTPLVLEAGWWRRSDHAVGTTVGVRTMGDRYWTLHCKTDSRTVHFGPPYFSLFSLYVILFQDWPKMGKLYHFLENQMGSLLLIQHYFMY